MVPEVQQTELFDILGNFFPFQPPDNPKNQNFKTEKKKKKTLEILSFYTFAP